MFRTNIGSQPSRAARPLIDRIWRGLPAIALILTVVGNLAAAEKKSKRDDRPSSEAGIQLRAEHIEGQGIPNARPLTPVELFPYYLNNDSLFFSSLRVYSTNDFTFGGNVGLGYRYYSKEMDRIFGGSVWYDADDTREAYLQQLGFNLESYADPLDFRANFYFPIGTDSRQQSLSAIPGTIRFEGNSLAYQQLRSEYVAMQGYDIALGVPLPTDFAREHNIRLYGGGYQYWDDRSNSISGGLARLQGNIVSGIDAMVQVTSDSFYDTRTFLGLSWTFGPLQNRRKESRTSFGRIGEHVVRNYTVLAPMRDQVESRLAVNPATSTPYSISHVASSAAAGGTGGVAQPFQDIASAQATNSDIVFVHSGSTFNGAPTVMMQNGERLLGDSTNAQYFVRVSELGLVQLPHAGTGAVPVISNSVGDAISLASNSELAGFTIIDPVGSGIVGTGIGNAFVSNMTIALPGEDGIRLLNTVGDISFANLSVSNSGANGINLLGGTADIDFRGPTSVVAAGGPAVSISNLASTGTVSFDDLGINQRQNRGLQIDNSAGAVTVSGIATIANEANSTASAVDMRNSSGTLSVHRLDALNTTGAPGVNLQNNTGGALFGTLNINSLNGTALSANNAGMVTVNPAVNGIVAGTVGGTISAVNGTAIDLQNTALNVNLTSVSSSNATAGIRLINTTGPVIVYGTGTAGSGGVIQGATTGLFLQNTGATAFQWLNLDNNVTGVHANNVTDLVLSHSFIRNSATYGIDALNTTTLFLTESTMSGNAFGSIRGQFDTVRSYSYIIDASELISPSANNIVLNALNGSAGALMNFTADQSRLQTDLAGSAGVKIDWNGALTSVIDESVFASSGSGNTAIMINNAMPTALSTVTMTNNQLAASATASTGLQLVTPGAAQLTATGNTLVFNHTSGTGFRMSVGSSSNLAINSNTITDNADGGTGILIDSIAGPSIVGISGNTMTFADSGGLTDRGIIFGNVVPTVTLNGTANNAVVNADTPIFIPAATTTGVLYVNGAAFP